MPTYICSFLLRLLQLLLGLLDRLGVLLHLILSALQFLLQALLFLLQLGKGQRVGLRGDSSACKAGRGSVLPFSSWGHPACVGHSRKTWTWTWTCPLTTLGLRVLGGLLVYSNLLDPHHP